MPGDFNQPPQPPPLSPEKTPECPPHVESIEGLKLLFKEAEKILQNEGREGAKLCLPGIYNHLIALNKRDKVDYKNTWVWNPEGALTKEQFNELNLRRKKLSNEMGMRLSDPKNITTPSGKFRHNLNKI